MKQNKLVIAMAAAALMSSMGAVADNTDTFEASYNVSDQITINGLSNVELSSEDTVADGSARGSTPFCVGRVGAGDGEGSNPDPLGYRVTVTTDNNYQLEQADELPLAYGLYYTATNTFDETDPIVAGDNTIDGSTSLTVDACNTNLEGTGYMWVRVPPASQAAATTGRYTDTVIMTVEAI